MTRSTIASLLQHIISVPVKPLIPYIVEKYAPLLELLPSKQLVQELHMAGKALGGSSPRVSDSSTSQTTQSAHDIHVAKQQKRHREQTEEESWFESDDSDSSDSTGGSNASLWSRFDGSSGGDGNRIGEREAYGAAQHLDIGPDSGDDLSTDTAVVKKARLEKRS